MSYRSPTKTRHFVKGDVVSPSRERIIMEQHSDGIVRERPIRDLDWLRAIMDLVYDLSLCRAFRSDGVLSSEIHGRTSSFMYDALRTKFPLKSIRDLAWYDIIHAVDKYYDEKDSVLVEILIFRTFLLDKISRCGYFLFCLGRCLFSDEVVRSHMPDALTFGASYSSEHIWRSYESSMSPTKTTPRVEIFSRIFPMGLHLSADVVVIPAVECLAMLLPRTSLQIDFVEYAKTRIRPSGTEGRYSILRLLFVWVSFFVDRFEKILLKGDEFLEETWIERCGFVLRRAMKQGFPLPSEEERAEEWIRTVRMVSFGSEEGDEQLPPHHQSQQRSLPQSKGKMRGGSSHRVEGDNGDVDAAEHDSEFAEDDQDDIEKPLTMEELEDWSVQFMNDSTVWSRMNSSVRQFVHESFSSTIVWEESANGKGRKHGDPEAASDILDERVLSSDVDVDFEGSDLSEGSLTLGDMKDDDDIERDGDATMNGNPQDSDDALSASLLKEDEESDAYADKSSENTVPVGDEDIDEMDLRRINSFAADPDEDQGITGSGPSERVDQNQRSDAGGDADGDADGDAGGDTGGDEEEDEELARSVADDEEDQRKQMQEAITESQSRIHELLEEVLQRHDASSSPSHHQVQWKRFEDTNALDLGRSGVSEEDERDGEEQYDEDGDHQYEDDYEDDDDHDGNGSDDDDDDDDDDDGDELELELYDIPGITMTESVDGFDEDSDYDDDVDYVYGDEYDGDDDVERQRQRPKQLDLDVMNEEVSHLENGDYLQPDGSSGAKEDEEDEDVDDGTGISDADFLELMKNAKYRADLVELVTETRAEFELEAFSSEFGQE